jgi:hypothetical protein
VIQRLRDPWDGKKVGNVGGGRGKPGKLEVVG